MSCSKLDFTVPNDRNGKLHRSVESVAGTDAVKATVLASYFSKPDFIDYVKSEVGDVAMLNINGNTLKRLLRTFFERNHIMIENSINKRALDSLDGFLSAKAKSVAKDHTANVLIENYYQEVGKAKENRLNQRGIIDKTTNQIVNTFMNSYSTPLFKSLKSTNPNEFEKLRAEINDILTRRNAKVNEHNIVAEQVQADLTNQELITRMNLLKDDIQDLDNAKFLFFAGIVEQYGNDRQKNFKALAYKAKGDPNGWYGQTLTIAKLANISREFNEVMESDKFDSPISFDENDMTNPESDGINEETRRWADDIGGYKDFGQHVAADMKLYFSTLYRLAEPNTTGTNYAFDTNNELGVPMTMGANYVIVQVSNYASFYSVEDFIASIERMASNIESLYGLSKLANDMKADRVFANKVMHELNNPKIRKVMVTIEAEGIKIDQSNKSVEPVTSMLYDLVNVAKATIPNNYDVGDAIQVRKVLNDIQKYRDDAVFAESMRRRTIDDFIVDTLTKYFPQLDSRNIINYLHADTNNGRAKYREIVNNISQFLTNAEKVITQENEVYQDFSKKYTEWKRGEEAFGQMGMVYTEPMPYYDNSRINYDVLISPLVEIARKLVPYTAVKNELNSTNAEGNLGSDLINNSYITNMIKQIQYGTPEDADAGLRNLMNFVTKSAQYNYSPIFFGIKDAQGRTLVPGLFERHISGKVTINPNAKELINISLFAGAVDQNNAKSALYSSMSKGDYFLSNLIAFHQPVRYAGDGTSNFDRAGFFTRTPSDAPKNFVVQAPAAHIWGLWNNDRASENAYVNTKIESLYSNHTFTNEMSDLVQEILFDTSDYNTNATSATELYSILNEVPATKNYNRLKVNELPNGFIELPLLYQSGDQVMIVVLEGKRLPNTINNMLGKMKVKYVYSNIGNSTREAVLPTDFTNTIHTLIAEEGIATGDITRNINKNHALFRGFYNNLYGELNNFVNNLNNVLEQDSKGRFVIKKSTEGLIELYHHKGALVADGKLAGNVFKFTRLFETNGFNTNDNLSQLLFLYGGTITDTSQPLLAVTSAGRVTLNTERTDLIKVDNGVISLNASEEINQLLEGVVNDWISNYAIEVNNRTQQYQTIVDERFTIEQIQDAMFNGALMNMNFDDIFEGDSKLYKDTQTFLKRAKEIQAGGKSFAGFDFNDAMGGKIRNIVNKAGAEQEILINGSSYMLPRKGITGIEMQAFKARNGFRAVTIRNTIRPSDNATNIFNELKTILGENMSSETAAIYAEQIARGYGYNRGLTTTVNDAQSYITLEEYIARRYADGTLNDYMPLIAQLMDDTPIEQIDLKGINTRIQVDKNFYYDRQFDENTNSYYSRQIKNAEFVLIPKLIKGTDLERLYKAMRANDIGQVNTVEADKAAKRSILTFWDNDGKVTPESEANFVSALAADNAVENYYYKYLYKQQQVSEHMKDEVNRAGTQIMKKIIDNASTGSQAVRDNVNTLFRNYVANIEEDFNLLLDRMGWKIGEQGQVIGKNGSEMLDFREFYKRAREEAQRLGMDSNFIDYLTPDALGQPTMPNYMNNVSSKLESIAQAIFNSSITRQKLPGWHAAQVTSVGYNSKLKYHPAVTDADGNVTQEAYAEVLIPRWSNLIPKDYDISKLEKEGLDLHIGYRIPTEGKQSVSILKVVGFLDDTYGSTIMLPDEWVAQTGSDFDVDSVYGIAYEMYRDKNGNIHKILFDESMDDAAIQRRYNNYVYDNLTRRIDRNIITDEFTRDDIRELRNELRDNRNDPYVVRMVASNADLLTKEEFAALPIEKQNSRRARNNKILDSMIAIMNDTSSREENFSRSNFDDLVEGKKKADSLRQANDLLDGAVSSIVRSPYNPLDQIDFMENAVSGMQLKAFSVTRDNFNSVNNYVGSRLNDTNSFVVEYDADQYSVEDITNAYGENVTYDAKSKTIRVRHNRLGNSINNRNVVGKLLTPYSSQTTAHILDAVKEGTIFNENDYTFGTFKTMIDAGMDYTTAIMFLQQPAITRIVNAYFETKSIYVNSGGNPINVAIKRIANDLGVLVGGKPVTDYTPIKAVYSALSREPMVKDGFRKLFGAEIDLNNISNEQVFTISGRLLENRYKYPKTYNNFTSEQEDNKGVIAAFDITTALTFEKLYNTTRGLEAIARVSNPDRFGAKQTVRATRQIRDNIVRYLTDDNIPTGKLLWAGDKPFLESLYPGILTGNIDVYNSSYPYLAAFLKYSTLPSIDINSRLFPTESEEYNSVADYVQNRLGVNFTDEQYKEYKQYMISELYAGVPSFTTPYKLNDYGWFVIDNEKAEQNAENNTDYWNAERARIFGYDTTQSVNFEVADINNPTADEANRFNNLTPAQKVIWIQQNFKDDKGVFDFLRVNTFNQREYRSKGFTSQTIRYNDQIDDIEEIYVAFRNSFFNKNPLVRLASLDLVKYAFIVEGFKFKKGNISKIITNDAMTANVENKGLDIIGAIQKNFALYNNAGTMASQRFIDRFVRSHSEIVKEYNIPKSKNKNGEENIGTKFARHIQTQRMSYIPFTEDATDILEFLNIDTNNPKDYIRITRNVAEGNRKETILYKIVPTDNGVYMYPLNILERNEVTQYSANFSNNKFKTEKFYEDIIAEARVQNLTINQLAKSEEFGWMFKDVEKKFTITRHKGARITESLENPQELQRIATDGTRIERANANKFIDDVNAYFNIPVENRGAYAVIRNDSYAISNMFPRGLEAEQVIPVGDDARLMRIARHKPSKMFNYILRGDKRGDIAKLPIEERTALDQTIASKSVHPTLYKVVEVSNEEVQSAQEAVEAQLIATREAEAERFAVSNIIEDVDIESNLEYDAIDKVAKDIFNELNRRHINEQDEYASRFIRTMQAHEADRGSARSIHNNRDNVLKSAAAYYTNKSQMLISQINGFTTATGEEFAINDQRLYDSLREHPEDYPQLIKLILDSKTFGEQFNSIFDLNLRGEDAETTNAINKIKNAITAVRNNTKVNNAMALVFNDYIANTYSTNPLVRHGIVDLRTQFGDTDWFDLNFSDIGELNNKQVQTVVKYVNGIINEATQVAAPKAVAEFKDHYAEIMDMADSFNWDNIITPQGKFITPYTDQFIEERQKHIDAVMNARDAYGIDSMEYINAKLARDKFREQNVEQEVIKQYYTSLNHITEKVVRSAPKVYLEYMRLIHELYADNTSTILTNKEEKLRRKAINKRISLLMNETDVNGNPKTDQEKFAIIQLKDFLEQKKKLNNEYFNWEEKDGFRDALNYNLRIVTEYEKKHPFDNLVDRLANDVYREAYEWIQSNTIYEIQPEAQVIINEAFKALKDTSNQRVGVTGSVLDNANAYDEAGNIDPRKLSSEDLAKLRKDQEHKYSWTYDNNAGEAILIKDVPAGVPVLKDTFYRMLRDPSENEKGVNPLRLQTIGRINELLGKAVDSNTGQIRTKDLFDALTSEELEELGNLYSGLHRIKGKRNSKELRNKFKKNVEFRSNDEAFNREWAYAQLHLKGTKDYQTWLNIFVQKDRDGEFILNDTGGFVPNNDMFGYMMPKDETYIDVEKTNAREVIESNIEFVPTEYYYQAMNEATAAGRFQEWFNENHIFNPYTHKMEPLRVWTTMQVNPNGNLKANYDYVPTFDNQDKTVKPEYKNPEFNKHPYNYNLKDGQYDNHAKLSTKESEMLSFLQGTINATASNSKMRKFADRGFLPRRATFKPDARWYASQALGAAGLEFRNTGETRWSERVDYTYDIKPEFDMLSLIKRKGYKDRLPITAQGTYETDAEYATRVADIREQNKKIDEENLKLDNEVLDRDWYNVFQDYINKSMEYNAKQSVKNTIYLLLEDLKTNPAYAISRYTGEVKEDRSRSTIEQTMYQTVDNRNTRDLVENWARRILRNEFKKDSKWNDVAGLMQNMTSAKYMVFNVTGGLANIMTGWNNILGEVFAKDYFDGNTIAAAQRRYTTNTISFIADMYSHTTNNLSVALTKMFDVVDFDYITERRPNETATQNVRRTRDALFGLQSGGEHYMQNTVMFAMLKSHRLFTDTDGTLRAGTLGEYNWELEMQTLMGLLNGREDMLNEYKVFIKSIKDDLRELKKYDLFSRDFNEEFLRTTGDKQLIKDYIAARKTALKKAKEYFKTLPLLEDQFELQQGVAVIKADSPVTGEMIGQIRQKIISVNKKIHGVYDKVGAARIEREWWGSLVMQYHKHLYPGIMKRYRTKGYYNEIRNSVEKGSYISLVNLLGTEFRGVIERSKTQAAEDNENVALRSILNLVKAAADTVLNIKLNYQLMPVWEQNNVRRSLADLLSVTSAVFAAIAIHAMTDDDELKDSNTLATSLYLMDRFASESQAYYPWGVIGEAKTLWSSPIASMGGPMDLLKGTSIVLQMLFDPTYEVTYKTGIYKGENKLEMLVRRNIPVLRIVDRLNNMAKNNNYYRLNENALNFVPVKAIADYINPD